jgi:hypothetical protein
MRKREAMNPGGGHGGAVVSVVIAGLMKAPGRVAATSDVIIREGG